MFHRSTPILRIPGAGSRLRNYADPRAGLQARARMPPKRRYAEARNLSSMIEARGPAADSRGAMSTCPQSNGSVEPLTLTTEITVVGGDRYRVKGDAKDVERTIVDAARGSIMELAWLVEAETEERIAINPECVVLLRAGGS
jgi:hypothetical protein